MTGGVKAEGLMSKLVLVLLVVLAASAGNAQTLTDADCVGVVDDNGIRVGGLATTDFTNVYLHFDVDGTAFSLLAKADGLAGQADQVHFGNTFCFGETRVDATSSSKPIAAVDPDGTTVYIGDTSAPTVSSSFSFLDVNTGVCNTTVSSGTFQPAPRYDNLLPTSTPPLHLVKVACPFAKTVPMQGSTAWIVSAVLMLTGLGLLIRQLRARGITATSL